ncbi:hypothetical protein [Chromobacterium violaceum]|uniref:hypothetical protein n=1 Tax=Chromobacterium violaceum TaxID=536 RepID=UPI0009DA75A7|nr:hypothetical protein [Chromobacterium violaceum]OQS48608.1 hypothetical protein B0T48_09210 [Chromobacterium violaceum]OQS52114.1 hypothetical protein B0T49_06030 [Chromobacterium violaceum]QRO33039.1 hypothetical protein I6K04_21720 [Chromobacterium violaceum]QRQ17160.1 hypothetical protein I6K03_01005 [Chromobacterium violaceum]
MFIRKAIAGAPAASAILLACLAGGASQAQNLVPADAAATCTVSPAIFQSWFLFDRVTPNGVVTPANSVKFNHDTVNPPASNKTINCNFYQWSQRMFLWLTSSPMRLFGGNGTVMDSVAFYSVLNSDDGKARCLVNRELGVNTCGGKPASLFSIRVNKPRFDKTDAADKDSGVTQADGSGPQQADGAALMGRGGKMVYYTILVNDVYAFFASASGTKNPRLRFPTTQAELDKVLAWAKQHHHRVPDADALALELKASWVEADGLDTNRYITTVGEIPVFDTRDPQKWVQTGSRQALLALVGLHVVGSAAGHPEMIWATFEHDSNSPNGAYSYINAQGATVAVPQEVPKGMLFSANGATGPFNIQHMYVDPDASPLTVRASSGQTVSPSDTLRTFPWGVSAALPIQPAQSAAQANSEVISINNSVRSLLKQGDTRRNYLLIGATWTNGGNDPYNPFQAAGGNNQPNHVGGNALANSTMETYVTLGNKLYNCFSCHNAGKATDTNAKATVGVSHIYESIKPFTDPQLNRLWEGVLAK